MLARPRGIINGYCDDPEDRVVRHSCPCCEQCWLFVQAKQVPVFNHEGQVVGYKSKVGTCITGGPHGGWDHELVLDHGWSS